MDVNHDARVLPATVRHRRTTSLFGWRPAYIPGTPQRVRFRCGTVRVYPVVQPVQAPGGPAEHRPGGELAIFESPAILLSSPLTCFLASWMGLFVLMSVLSSK